MGLNAMRSPSDQPFSLINDDVILSVLIIVLVILVIIVIALVFVILILIGINCYWD